MGAAEAVEAFSARNPHARASLREDGLGLILGVSGSLDLQVSYELQKLLALMVGVLEVGKRLAIDLSAVSYISSTGVGALANALVDARRKDVGIIFRNMPQAVSSILEVLGLLNFFPVEDGGA
jgi:anti-anti-sigma factor